MANKREFMSNVKTTQDLKLFQDYLYQKFKNRDISSNFKPINFIWLQKHKFENIDEINVQSQNFRPFMAKTGTCTYNAAQVISKPLEASIHPQ